MNIIPPKGVSNLVNKDDKKPPVRPRDAATLIVLRINRNTTEVLMGRRHKNARFMPNMYVFPGGKVEDCDKLAIPAAPLNKNITPNILKVRNYQAAQTLAMTAIRETAEETGLLLARPANLGNNIPEDPENGYNIMNKNKLAPSLDKLSYLGRAITPTFIKIRFHARFFVANEKDSVGKIHPSSELDEVIWIPLLEANQLPTADVTLFMLNELIKHNNLNKVLDPDIPKPMFTWRNGKPWIQRS